ncbi:MAG: 4'-phosphopantetheinyl transferase superfamily protein [Candidatus Competibacteraceae bacterium]|nr:4'-phosphopantetheinyl transferase superfamily protein [Candidatus Competibacteraceae bacterium]
MFGMQAIPEGRLWRSAIAPAKFLGPDEVWVWWASLRQSPERLAGLTETLSVEERERAARFRFPQHRDRFIAGRGLLRELLEACLSRPAAAFCFDRGLHGKPTLAGIEGTLGLHFNLSHSGDRALYALARHDVGVDLECHDRNLQMAAIRDRVCTAREVAVLKNGPFDQQREAFFACWTRKEAIAKALGGGLASGLQKLEVCIEETTPPKGRVCLRDDEGRQWSVLSLPVGVGWSGALAAVGWRWRWKVWDPRDRLFDQSEG